MAIPNSGYAKSTKPSDESKISQTDSLDIRPIEHSSVDVFDVLSHIPVADKAFRDGDYRLAFEHYRYVYMHDPQQMQASIGYADAALALGQIALAAGIYKAFAHDNIRAQSGLLLAGILQNTLKNPEDHLRKQLEKTSDDARLWNMLGQILDTKMRGSEARQAYAMAQLSGQRSGLAANNIGQSFLKEGRLHEALSEFTRAVYEAPKNRKFDNNRRMALLLQKDYSQALLALETDRAAQLLKDAGLIAAQQGETKLAILFLEKSMALNPIYDSQAAQYLDHLSQ